MRRVLVLYLTLLLLPSVASYPHFEDYGFRAEVTEEGWSQVELEFTYNEEVEEVSFPFYVEYAELNVKNGECEVLEDERGEVLRCQPPSEFLVGETTSRVSFRTQGFVEEGLFSLDLPVPVNTQHLSVDVKLPRDMTLSDDVTTPLSPSGSQALLVDRRVLLVWDFNELRKDDLIPLRIYYESLAPEEDHILRDALLIILVIIFVAVYPVYRLITKKKKIVRTVLDESERRVFDLLSQAEGKTLQQKQLVRKTGFSKAKTSRLVRDLEERGVISVEREGRRNRLTLK